MTLSQRLHERCGCGAAKTTFSLAGTERKYERSRPYRIEHLFIDLTLEFETKSVRGRAVLDFLRVSPKESSLLVDAIGFELESVRVDDGSGLKPASYSYDGEVLALEGLPERGQLRIDYKATPKRGLYFLAPDEQVKHRPLQAWTQCQDEDARHFIPCVDKPHVKMTTELSATVPSGFQVLSNGELVSAETRGKTPWTYRFKLDQPHPSYLLTLVVGHFDVVQDRTATLATRNVPITYLVPVGQAAAAARSLGETPQMLEFFSERFGVDFPWQRYSQAVVSDFIFGGMENTTATTLYEHVMLDERAALDISSNDLVAHELAHQWFGDYVTCRDWSHAWLNEGFATFCEHLEREHRLGRDEYDYGVAGDVDTYLSEAGGRYQRPIVCRDYAEPIDLFDRHLYEKGGLVLHMLRRELTDAVFFEGVKRYLKRHAFGIVETTDLMRAFEEVSGRSFERFFDQWVYRPGHPELKVSVSYDDGLLAVAIKQSQKTGETALFALPIEIEVTHNDGTRTRHHKLVTEAHDVLTLPLDKRPLHVGFDPEQRVISKLTFEAPGDMLRHQLAEGSNALLRWTAADALSKKNDPSSVKALRETLARDAEAWMVRVEAARALGKVRSDDAFDALSNALGTSHPKVRRAVVTAVGAFKKPAAAKALQDLLEDEPSYLVSADAARALGRTRQPGALETLKSIVDQASWADVIRAGALDGMASLRDDNALDVVAKRTRYGIPTRGRRAAVHALASLGEGRKTREQLEDLLDDKDPHFKIDVVAALTSLGDGKSRGAMRRALDRELDGRVSRRLREALRDLGDNPTQEKKRLNDELESVRDELIELKNRLAKLEGRKTDKSKASADAKAEAKANPEAKAKAKAKPDAKAEPALPETEAKAVKAAAKSPPAPTPPPAPPKKAAKKAQAKPSAPAKQAAAKKAAKPEKKPPAKGRKK
ncbi:MAG TPA: M1 family aminopeptidase [Polyangiaceae bacterium]|nr:M1 family aminopeptidase [Polyangiaceae bacterium]